MTVVAFIAAIAAFALFALSTDPHAAAWLHARPSPLARRRRRAGAWALLAIAFALSVAARGWVFGPVIWSGIVMAGAGVVFLVLNLSPIKPEKKS